MSSEATSIEWKAGIESDDPTINLFRVVERLSKGNEAPTKDEILRIKALINDGESGLKRLELDLEEAGALTQHKMRLYSLREKLKIYRRTISPIRKLPFESLLEIFGYLHDGPLPLSQVCSLWRELALATSSLWSKFNLCLSSGRLNRQSRFANMWLDRAGSHPLSITIRYRFLQKVDIDVVRKILEPRFATIRDLQLRLGDSAVRALFHDASPVMPLLESLLLDMTWNSPTSLGHLNAPRLRTLSMHGHGTNLRSDEICRETLSFVRHYCHQLRSLHLGPIDLSSDIYDRLRDFPELEDFHLLFSCNDLRLDRFPPTNTLNLPKIRRLRLESTYSRTHTISTFLSGLTLPSLSRLEINYRFQQSWGSFPPMTWLHTDLPRFLKRSQCKIETLLLDLSLPRDPSDLHKLFCALPDLKRLDIQISDSNYLDLSETLKDMTASEYNSPILPHLQQLRVGRLSLADTGSMISMVKSRLWSDPNIAFRHGVSRLNLITNLFAPDEVENAEFFTLIRGLKNHVAQFEGVHFFEDESEDYICD